MQKHSFVLLFCGDLIITLVQCFCISYFEAKSTIRKNGESQIKVWLTNVEQSNIIYKYRVSIFIGC